MPVAQPTSLVRRHRVSRRVLLVIVLLAATSTATTAAALTAHRHAVAIFGPAAFDRAVSTDPQALAGRTVAVGGVVARVWGAGPSSTSPLRLSSRAARSGRLLVLVGDVTLDCPHPTRVDFLRGDAVQVIGLVASWHRTASGVTVELTHASALPKDAVGAAGQTTPVFYLDPRYGFQLTYLGPTLRALPGTTSRGVYQVRVEPAWASLDPGLSSFVAVAVVARPAGLPAALRSTTSARARLVGAGVEALLARSLNAALPAGSAVTGRTAPVVDPGDTPTVRCTFAVAVGGVTATCRAVGFVTNGRIVCVETIVAPGDGASVVGALSAAARSFSLRPTAAASSSD